MSTPSPVDAARTTKDDLGGVLDRLAEGVVTLDGRGRIVGINRAACRILEIDPVEALDAHCCELLDSQFCGSAEVVRESIREHRPVSDVEVPVETRSGRRRVLVVQTGSLGNGREHRGSVVVLRDVTELAALKEDLARRYRLHNVVGKSKPMQEIFRLVEEVADSEATVLIEGESGTGKELVARAIHHLSPRAGGPFVAVHCSIPAEDVLASELFGHVRDAFPGAMRDKRGRFEAAAGGTILLDEVGALPPGIQVTLLRVLQERAVERVGDDRPIGIDVRVIAASHRPLAELVAEGSFRRDLYYKLRVVPMAIPPLRDRRDDVGLLAQHFAERFRDETGRPIEGFSPEALALLVDYAWPGNVRELESAVEYAFVKARRGPIAPAHLPPELGAPAAPAVPPAVDIPPDPSPPERRRGLPPSTSAEAVRAALVGADWNVAKAARRLSISRTTLYKRIAQLKLARPEDEPPV